MTALADLAAPDRHAGLAAVLRPWLPRQRWFAGKARTVTGVAVADTVLLGDGDAAVLDVVVDVRFADGAAERYQVPLAAADGDEADGLVATLPTLRLVDATFVAPAVAVLAACAVDPSPHAAAGGGVVRGAPTGGDDDALDVSSPRRLTAEQSNTSVVFAERTILKVFRKLEHGENPDVEVTRALTTAGFPHAPAQCGALTLHDRSGDVMCLGVLAAFVAGAREGWALATGEVRRLVDSPVGCALTDGDLAERFADLGRAVADLHAALRDTLGSRDAGAADLEEWVDGMRAQAERVLETAAARAPDAAAAVLRQREALLARFGRLAAESATGPLTRTHGDLHLGQVLLDRDDRWQILDFEGEPARPLRERRRLGPPLRDVAGMLRSFDYAAAQASGGDLAGVPDVAAAWRDGARRDFLDAYLARAGEHGVVPHRDAAVSAQLEAFELDKAVYELGYELGNRPDWVPIPVGGIARVLAGA